MPSPITVTLRFDEALQKLTATASGPVVLSEGANFMLLLMSVFAEYPAIEETYSPGELGFTINGVPPKPYTPLFDGDDILFSVS